MVAVAPKIAQFWNVCRRTARRYPWLADGLLAVVVLALGLWLAAQSAPSHIRPTGPSLVMSMIGCAALVVRRSWPGAVLAVVLGCTVLVFILNLTPDDSPPLTFATGVALYSLAVYRSREAAWISALTSMIVLIPPALLQKQGVVAVVLGLSTWVVSATATGDAVRSRRAYIAAVEDRARRAEQSREEEARRQVAEERLRIARELHDVVAHHITLVKVQAAVASHMLYEQPAGADEALGHIRRASATVLDELKLLLYALRDTSEPVSTQPPAGLSQLPTLLSGFVAGGMSVALDVTGQSRELPALTDLAAYRIVQESLTNAHKHSRGARTSVAVGYGSGELRLRIHNTAGMPHPASGGTGQSPGTGPGRRFPGTGPTRKQPATGPAQHPAAQRGRGGHGLLGMRERAAAVGGHMQAGSDGEGGFVVTATLPVPEAPPPAPTASTFNGRRGSVTLQTATATPRTALVKVTPQ